MSPFSFPDQRNSSRRHALLSHNAAMGVMATYCQVCGVPVHQDHTPPLFAFGAEHAWLKDAIGLAMNEGETPAVIEGEAHDGAIGAGCLVQEGIDERVALHKLCWELAGKPESWEEIEGITLPDVIESYREQLFEFTRFVGDGHGWMLVSPAGKTDPAKKNRVRILRALGRKVD